MRVLGTALPFTMATFCAMAEEATDHQAGCSQGGQNVLLHTVSFRNALNLRVARGRGFGLNRQGVQALINEILQRIIHKAMPCYAAHTGK